MNGSTHSPDTMEENDDEKCPELKFQTRDCNTNKCSTIPTTG